MAERRSLSVSVVGHVVEDLSLRPLEPGRYRATIAALRQEAVYKADGFFVFSGLPAGLHTVDIEARRFQPESFAVSVPLAQPVVEQPAGNELLVRLTGVEPPAGNLPGRLLFAPVSVPLAVRAGSRVLAAGLETTLAEPVEAGIAMAVRVAAVGGLMAGDLVRVVRQRSFRLRHDPYSVVPVGRTRVAVQVAANAGGSPVAGAAVRLAAVGALPVVTRMVAGAEVAQVLAVGGPRLLGWLRDLTTASNARGDAQLYFPESDFFDSDLSQNVTVTISAAGFFTVRRTMAVTPGARTSVRVGLDRT